MIDFISQSWHWAISGALIALVMLLLLISGERFGISSSFKTVCNILGADRWSGYFKYDWRQEAWLLLFVVGTIAGGYIATSFLSSGKPLAISQATAEDLAKLGIEAPGGNRVNSDFIPMEIFAMDRMKDPKTFVYLIVGGVLIGFGTRWAGGCTSGHAISGLSNFQLPSLVAVIGFFIGGLLMTHLLFPIIFS